MHALSTDTDLNPLVGCRLTFVGFGEYQLQLAFYAGIRCLISVERDYTVASCGLEMPTYSDAVAGAQALLPLLGHDVKAATVPTEGTVRVVFDEDSVIEVLDSSSENESYDIHLGEDIRSSR